MKAANAMTLIRRRLEGDQGVALGISAALVLSYPLIIVTALWPAPWLFAVFALISYAAEAAAVRHAGYVSTALTQVALGLTLRFVVREAALLLLLARSATLDTGWVASVAVGLMLLHVVRAAHSSIAVLVTQRRRLPVLTRGINTSPLRIPAAPPRLLSTQHTRTMLHLDVPVVIGALIGLAAGTAWPVLGGLVIAFAIGLCAVTVMARHARRNRHMDDKEQVLRMVADEVARHQPEVVLYFSGATDCMYQIDMWLETLDRLRHSTMIILRERANLPLLGQTTAPVLCIPTGADMMNFPMPESVRVALFPANAGKNIHMLRLPDIKSVFIGHGDSDKAASFNPFSKVYDEVWVAGPAGRERYLRSDAGVRDEDIVEVGRPQLASIQVGAPTPDPIFTVLYAPTWEGWSGDEFHTSVAMMGPEIVRTLLAHGPHLRLLYKPHPMAGKNNPAVRRAHQKIVSMIETANAARDDSGEWGADPARAAEARSRLDELTTRLERLGGTAADAGAEAHVAQDAAWRQTLKEWDQAYWEAEGWWRHRVITGSNPHLYSCFNHADLLITDISSVVADFIASGKPYVVTNGAGLADDDFRMQNPSASAAYLLSRDCSKLTGLLAAVATDGDDPMAERRRQLKHHLLGPDAPDAMTRFAQAVDALIKTE
ncbi:MAG: CDP-Glycerol:Poly(Glycerophosphate) glycerophosphotransferase [Sphaerisporangium sp.]|nr:CDP-Glycerol:Poly(Glycerophosphate) glycerophosphotransferase [Sphaerisporangium sp.]